MISALTKALDQNEGKSYLFVNPLTFVQPGETEVGTPRGRSTSALNTQVGNKELEDPGQPHEGEVTETMS
jgi:hypothetical protein